MAQSFKLPNYSLYSPVKEVEEYDEEKFLEEPPKKRVQQTAEERHSENAQKVRKLDVS